MRLGKKLLDVASNFFEIEREEKPSRRTAPVDDTEMQSAPAEPAAPDPMFENSVDEGAQANQELDAYMRGMDGSGEYAAAEANEVMTAEAPSAEPPAPQYPATVEAVISVPAIFPPVSSEPEAEQEIATEPQFAEEEELPPSPEDSELMDDLATAISDSGEVNFERIFQSAKLPEARFTAEQAVNMLNALPENLPIAIKRKTVTATFAALGNPSGAEPNAIRADATGKRESLSVYLDALTSQTEQICRESQEEITHLEEQLLHHRERKAEAERKHAIAWEACRRQMGLMDEVMVFFNDETEEASPVLSRSSQAEEEAPAYDEDDLPAFLTNDNAYRLLGITGEAPSLEQIVEEGGFEVDASTLEAQAENAEADDRNDRRPRRRSGGATTATE